MSMFNEAIETILNREEFYKEKDKLNQEQSQLDRAVSDYYHLFEFGSFPDHIILEVHRGLVQILKKRRIYKDKFALLQALEERIIAPRQYNVRVLNQEIVKYVEFLPPECFVIREEGEDIE